MTLPPPPSRELMDADLASRLGECARMVKAATRAVSLYPSTHPSIQSALTRVVNASGRLTADGDVTVIVYPDALTIDGRAPARPDAGVIELAGLLHDHLVGEIRIDRGADVDDWHALLTLLGRTPGDLIAAGGIEQAWTLTGRARFAIREIDYAEVLRERASGEAAQWDRIVTNCLRGESVDLDEKTLATLREITGDPVRCGNFLARLQQDTGAMKAGARTAALLRIVRSLVRALAGGTPEELDGLLGSIADGTARLTPEMMLAMLAQAQSAGGTEEAVVAARIVGRIGARTVASFVAGNIIAERGATARLAQVFETLVPDTQHRPAVLAAAHDEAAQSALGNDSGFEELWQNAAGMLLSYSDQPYVSAEYGRELSDARRQAVEVERIADDPPDRIQAWLSTISDPALRQLDIELLLDLLVLEGDSDRWSAVAGVVVTQVERLTLLGDAAGAHRLVETVVRERSAGGRETLRQVAAKAAEQLAAGPLVRHVTLQLRTVDDVRVEPFNRLCHTLGPIVIRPLAEALAGEENYRAIRRLRDLLMGFGPAGRQSVEQLKHSANPAVRRTAVDLLRVFGGHDALPELASMLGDADPQVLREAIRAIAQIGTEGAYAVLERALIGGAARSRDTILQQLLALHDDKAAPLFCYVLTHTSPRGRLVEVHRAIIESLGGLGDQRDSTRTLTRVLQRGDWWAPFRTARLRRAAAAALRRIGSPDAVASLEQAVAEGRRGVRNAARAQGDPARSGPARERVR